ncbi:transposase [Erwinia rhapontici]|uniref:transposase n=1 Tax=Erwinia rhapontici TaxID=55212 RepID=UPI0013312D9A|nr:transposase [Erwinia rhapontici]MBP2154265.1 transposase [Erwinia rhapontici]
METVQAKRDWRSAPRQFYSPEFKLKLVLLALQPATSVADVGRRHNVNDNLLFKWIRLFQSEGQVTRRQSKACHIPPALMLLPVHITENTATPTTSQRPSLEHPCSCDVTFARGRLTLTSPSTEFLTVLVRELMNGPHS